jgi:hypothetical protein
MCSKSCRLTEELAARLSGSSMLGLMSSDRSWCVVATDLPRQYHCNSWGSDGSEQRHVTGAGNSGPASPR